MCDGLPHEAEYIYRPRHTGGNGASDTDNDHANSSDEENNTDDEIPRERARKSTVRESDAGQFLSLTFSNRDHS